MAAPAWYAVRTRSNHEFVATAGLGAVPGFETFLPVLMAQSVRRRRRVVVRRPLFPGYFFACATLTRAARIAILKAPGVLHLVGSEKSPVPVPAWQIESIRIALASRDALDVLNYLVPGKRVRVVVGALAGVEGVLVAGPGGSQRVVISLELMGRSVAVRISSLDVEPLP